MARRNLWYILLILCMGCVHTEKVSAKKEMPTVPRTKYKVGECTYLIDPETGRGNKADIMRVDSITKEGYYYRWWTYQEEWAIDTNYRPHGRYEAMTKPIRCPGNVKTNRIKARPISL